MVADNSSFHNTDRQTRRVKSALESYMSRMSAHDFDFDRFVEDGARLYEATDIDGILCKPAELESKLIEIRQEHPQLARQLEFLHTFMNFTHEHTPETVRREVAFALIYCVRGMDLMPDDVPQVGYLDDASVTEVVLLRHREIFQQFCTTHGIEWASLCNAKI